MKKIIFRQFGNPSGVLRRLVGWIMTSSNRKLYKWTQEQIQARSHHQILELGYGTGFLLKEVANQLVHGRITGIDHSNLMYRRCMKRCAKQIENGTAAVYHGSAGFLTLKKSFDRIYAVNVHFFWPDQQAVFRHLFSLLKENGKLVLVFQPRWLRTAEEVRSAAEKTRCTLEETGFTTVYIDYKPLKPVWGVGISAVKDDASVPSI